MSTNRELQRLVGESSTLFAALDQVSAAAPLNRPVLVLGERGSGKELIAERLHYLSPRWERELHKVNCAAISDALLDSDLFGHEPGAFTGATRVHYGRFERADGGTLFLDELGAMSVRIQEKLLRLIEYGEFERLGGQKTLSVDVRIVAATNADLKAMAGKKEFREDLLDRLAFDVIHVPPLRRRLDDIPELVDHFATRMSHELGWEYYSGFSEAALAELCAYDWPGNIRELKNVVERSLYRWGSRDEPVATVIIDPFQTESAPAVGEDKPAADGKKLEKVEKVPFESRVKNFELAILKEALAECRHHQKNTAEMLGLTYHQLRALLRKYKDDL